jgi:thiamine-phosphate pyrophosphorylase
VSTAPRLYLIVAEADDSAAAAADLAAALDGAQGIEIACIELDLPDGPDFAWRPAIDALRPAAQDRGVAVLLRDRAGLAAATGCDGVRLSSFADYRAARRAVGSGIVGVDAGVSRHQAMLAGEAEADFVGLGPAEGGGPATDFVAWWSELMEIPAVAFGARGPQDAAAAAEAGAEFLAADPRLWPEPGGLAGLVRAAGHAIAG